MTVLAMIGAREIAFSGRVLVQFQCIDESDARVVPPVYTPERMHSSQVKLGDSLDTVSQITFSEVSQQSDAELLEGWDGAPCFPIHNWQLPKYSPFACNLMHELDIERANNGLENINCGGSRCAFKIQGMEGASLVIKTPKFRSNFEPSDYHSGWKDTIAMERLYASPFVLDLYANCGVSQLTELAEGGNLHDQMKIARQYGDKMSPDDKLRIGYHISTAVADMHSIDGDEPPMSHNDLCCHQFMFLDGVFKLNDFHLASFNSVDREKTVCLNKPKGMASNLAKTRAPEELENHKRNYIRRDKVDVYMIGNLLYYVLTKKWLYEGIPTENATTLNVAGKTSTIPSKIQNSTDPADKAMVKAIQMAWTRDPNERPTAGQISSFLQEQLKKLHPTEQEMKFRVSLPPLPVNHRYTDSDFYDNLLM